MSRRHQTTIDQIEYSQSRQEFPEIPFDRYRITQHVGKGAFSKVFLAYTPEFQRRAIKRIRLTAKPHQLLKEIEFLRRLEGKSHIVQIKEIRFHETTLQTTVITSYSDTDDFKSVILDFTPREIQAYMRSILTALSHLEKLKIIHRDIKPGNFLFERRSGKGLLIDFGLAQTLREVREFPLLRGQSRSRKGVIHINLDRLVRQSQQFLNDLNSQREEVYYSQRMLVKEGQGVPSTHAVSGMTPSTANIVRPNDETFDRLPIAGYINKDQSAARPLPPSAHSGTHGYRAPEILVPVRNQDCKIDSWSVGVILIQILTGKTSLFRGNPTVDIYEILAIRSIIGTDRFIQGMSRLKADFSLTAGAPMPQSISLEELAEWYNPDLLAVLPASCFDLCRRLLAFDPESRLSATEALSHPFLAIDEALLPNYRFQDGAHSRSLLSFTGYTGSVSVHDNANREEETLQALRKRSSDIAERLGLCRVTSETLADEYSTMAPQSMIPLPRELRKQAQKSVQRFELDKTVQGPSGIIVERSKPSDYSFPNNSSVQDLGACGGVTLSRPRLAAAPGSQARHCAIDAAERAKIAEYREKGIRITLDDLRREVLDEQWEIANRDKESFERAVRATAIRRRLDPWIQPLKGLDKELRLCQKDVRRAAEEYRRVVLSLGLLSHEAEGETPHPEKKTGPSTSTTATAGVGGEGRQLRDGKGKTSNFAASVTGQSTAMNYHSYLSSLIPSPNALRTAVNIKMRCDTQIQVAKTADVKTVESWYYPKNYSFAKIRGHRLLNFIIREELVQNSVPTALGFAPGGQGEPENAAIKGLASDLASRAWQLVQNAAARNKFTKSASQEVYNLTLKAAKIASVSHRLALSGPDAWEAKGESFFLSPTSTLGKHAIKADELKSSIHDTNTRLLQHQHHASQCQFIIQERMMLLAKIRHVVEATQARLDALNTQITVLTSSLQNSPAKSRDSLQEELTQQTARRDGLVDSLSKLATLAAENESVITQNRAHYTSLTQEIEGLAASKRQLSQDYQKLFDSHIRDAEYSFDDAQENFQENYSDCWSETISVSDEGSEAQPAFKPFGIYNPSELQEPYFSSLDEMKAALRKQDIAADRRKGRREQRRRLECLLAKRRDPVVDQLRVLNDEIQRARADLLAGTITDAGTTQQNSCTESRTSHNAIMPKQALVVSPSMLAQAVAIKALAAKYASVLGLYSKTALTGAPGGITSSASLAAAGRTRRPADIDSAGAAEKEAQEGTAHDRLGGRSTDVSQLSRANISALTHNTTLGNQTLGGNRERPWSLAEDNQQLSTLKPYARNAMAYLAQQLEVERKAHALFTLFSSPYGRYLMPFHKIISEGAPFPSGIRSNSFYLMCTKSDLCIPNELQEAILTLQTLAERYFRTTIGRKDLYLIAAACQTELDLRAQNATNTNNPNNANNELQHLGLSRRPPNLDYMLLLQNKLSSLIPFYEDTRSTSAITGLNRSATHRSLADPSRTSQRYPQTCKYIQTVLEQVMRRFVAMPGVLSSLLEECTEGIANIKGRILEAVIIEMRNALRSGSVANNDNITTGCSAYGNNVLLRQSLDLLLQAIGTLGAGTVFEILRGLTHPVTLLKGCGLIKEQAASPTEAATEAAAKTKRAFNYLTDEDVRAIKQAATSGDVVGSFDEKLIRKIDDSNARRRILLQTQYGGRHHLEVIRRRKRRMGIVF
ncbi:Kinase, CDC7 [Giardia muris]|uniref:non-specific serine/threonine protein kinase n=1 Tax=Giardia muris TaxID=5742 RepID=A0A4Z1SLD3_GIAMU|nr:Kinase, CDC7 [Giardia muris]|eukprot:TNJ26452.1 Kinase, CDC7 [Giardia muris]